MTLEEAKALMTQEALDKLKETVTLRPNINMDNKANNDILMAALCKAVSENVILVDSLDDTTVKLLNAKTNTLSPTKLGLILKTVRESQPHIGCVITLVKPIDEEIKRWEFTDEGASLSFAEMFGFVLQYFNLSPAQVRTDMSEILKPTIVNNIAQLVAKYQYGTDEDRRDVKPSIVTITRLVNMCKYMLFAEFKSIK